VWRCHIGSDSQGAVVEEAWEFLRPHVEVAPLAVFSRAAYVPRWLPCTRAVVLPPNIDPFSVKNQWLPERAILGILGEAGLLAAPPEASDPVFVSDDGSTRRVSRRASVVRAGPPPDAGAPLVVQVSRWDRMKDPVGVLAGFAKLTQRGDARGAHLVLAGPAVRGVADDPESPEVLAEVTRAFLALPPATRSAVHLAEIPMDDLDENAAIVNALQRHAAVIVQKSLREGFGLTVTEAMWKRRPVVASAVGGIRDQIRDGVEGLLVEDPTDPGALAAAITRVLASPELAARLGDAGYERVRSSYLVATSLERWADLVRLLLDPTRGAAAA
jgi:trehalose synthase